MRTISARRSCRVNLRGHRGLGVIAFARPGADFRLCQSSPPVPLSDVLTPCPPLRDVLTPCPPLHVVERGDEDQNAASAAGPSRGLSPDSSAHLSQSSPQSLPPPKQRTSGPEESRVNSPARPLSVN